MSGGAQSFQFARHSSSHIWNGVVPVQGVIDLRLSFCLVVVRRKIGGGCRSTARCFLASQFILDIVFVLEETVEETKSSSRHRPHKGLASYFQLIYGDYFNHRVSLPDLVMQQRIEYCPQLFPRR